MNYIFLAKRENVKKYAASNDKMALLLKDGSFFYNNENFGKAVDGFFFQGLFLYYSVDGVSTTIMNTNTEEKKYIPKVFNADTVQTNTFLMGSNYERVSNTLFYSAEISLYQLNPYNLKKRLPHRYIFSQFLRIGNLLFTEKLKTTLSSLSLLTGEYEWEVDLGEKLGTYDSIAKIVGVVDEVLWVISQRGILFGIEINTGELLYHLNYDNVESFKEIGNVSAKYFYSLFDEANKKLIGIYRNQCWEIDLTKPTTGLQVFDLEAINLTYFSHPDFYFRGSYWAAPEGVTFDNDYIYFRDIEVATVGIMHRQTKQIEWHTRLNDQEPMVRDVINDIQVPDNKLYVLDSGGTLHIFEKEEVA